MTTQLSTTKRICEHLEKYVFDRVWNEPYTQYRSYIKPELLSKNVELDHNGQPKKRGDEVLYRPYFAAGFFPSRYGSILLPPYSSDEELLDWLPKNGLQFAVYMVPASFFGSTVLNIPDWTLFSTYCTKNHLDLQMFTSEGLCLNRGYIYIKQSDQNDGMLIAVESNMYRKVVGDIGKFEESTQSFPHADDMILGKYFDSDQDADNMVGFARLTAAQLPRVRSMETLGQITLPTGKEGEKVKLADANYVTKNGLLCVGDYSSLIRAKDYVEAVVDKDILGVVDVDLDPELVYTDNLTESSSPGTGTTRLLIHIPKSINPEYRLITPDTCGVWVYPTGRDCTEGLHLYACDREDMFHQVTHSDFSINTSLLEEIKTQKGWENITVRVYVRSHGHSSMFIRDGHYIDFLYNLDDDELIPMLLGKHSWQTTKNVLLFWRADVLEDSKYTDALLRRRCKEQTLYAIDEDDHSAAYEGKNQWCKRDNYATTPRPRGQCSVCGINSLCPYHQAGDPVKTYDCPYYTSRSLQDYIDILGYFHVLALIGKRVHHFRVLQSGVQSVVVSVPLALSYPELETEDYYPVVYINGNRVDHCDINWHETASTNTAVKEIGHNDTETVETASIDSMNYATRLKIGINKVYKETKTITFTNDTRYYKIDPVSGEYVRALVVEAQPVKIIERGPEGERIPQTFESGLVYYSRINKEYRKLKVGEDYNVGDNMEDFVNSNGGYLLFTGLDGLDINELACLDGVVGDYVKTTSDPRVIYELHNDIKLGDTISVELFDRRHKGAFEILNMEEHQSELEVKHTFATLDSWYVYSIGEALDIDGTTKHVYSPIDREDLGTFDRKTYTLTFFPAIVAAGGSYLIVEGPNTIENSKEFTINRGEFHDYSYTPGTTRIIGEDLYKEDGVADPLAVPLDSELVFLNGKRLIPDLDYVTKGYEKIDGNTDTLSVYGQCVSYLKEVNTLNVIRTNTTIIPYSVQRGFVIGSHISWKGQTPIWFDELSTLTVDGKLVANYKQVLGEMTLNPVKCRNGATYEVKTSVSTLIKDIMNYQSAMEEDLRRIQQIHEFFIEAFELPDMSAIIPHSHRLYSIFLEAIISKYLNDETYEITRLSACPGETQADKLAAYKQQFFNDSYFSALYDLDVIYDSSKMLDYYLNFIDVYGIYHPLVAKYREDYTTLRELCEVFLPEDNIKHKENKK